jgi:single-strand DNA-binding protein
MNQVWINGRLASDPESGTSAQGVTYARFQVAIEHGYGENKTVMFLDCCAFRKTADFISQYFKKGDSCNLTGAISVRDWTDQNEVKRRKYEILVSQAEFPVSGRRQQSKSNGSGQRQRTSQSSSQSAPAPVGADIPEEPWDNNF